jgi:hypothetical protein
MLVGDRERERTAASLRHHYVSGRLSFEEFTERAQVALQARSRADVRAALRDLPLGWNDLPENVHAAARTAGRVAARGALLLALGTAWLMVSFLIMVAFAVSLVVDGPSVVELIVFPLLWLLATYGLLRMWRRGAAHASARLPARRARMLL